MDRNSEKGILDQSTCAWLDQAESLLVDRADPKLLGQVLIDLKLLSEEDIRKTMVGLDISSTMKVFVEKACETNVYQVNNML